MENFVKLLSEFVAASGLFVCFFFKNSINMNGSFSKKNYFKNARS